MELFIEKLGCDPVPQSFFLVVSTRWKNSICVQMARSFHYPKWMSMVNVVEMIGLKTTMLSQQKIAEDLKLEKHVTCRGVRPSPDLMEIEVFGDF